MMSYVLFTLCVGFGLYYVRLESPRLLEDFYVAVAAELKRFCIMKREWPTARYKELLKESKQFARNHLLISIFANFVPDRHFSVPQGLEYPREIGINQWPRKAITTVGLHDFFAQGGDKRIVLICSIIVPTAYLWIMHFRSILSPDATAFSGVFMFLEAVFLLAFTLIPGIFVFLGKQFVPQSRHLVMEAVGRINEEIVRDQSLTKTKI